MSVARFDVLSGTIDGANQVFTTPAPYAAGSTALFLNGQLKLDTNDDGWVETDPATGVLTLKEAPLAGDVVQAFYLDLTVVPTTKLTGVLRVLRPIQPT